MQVCSTLFNCYSPDLYSDQILSIPLNFQNVTDLNQIHIERNVRLHLEHPDVLKKGSSVIANRITQVSDNLISGYSLFKAALLTILWPFHLFLKLCFKTTNLHCLP